MEPESTVSNFVMTDAETWSEGSRYFYTQPAEEGKTGTQPRTLEVEIVSSRRKLTVTTNGKMVSTIEMVSAFGIRDYQNSW